MPRALTPRQLARTPCLRCDAPSATQWRACADGTYRYLCAACDVGLNEIILRWFGLPDAEAQIDAYREKMCLNDPNPLPIVRDRGHSDRKRVVRRAVVLG